MQKLVRCAAIAALLGFVHTAAAQPSAEAVETAAAEFAEGRSAYQAGDYVTAAEHFEAADQTAPNPNALRAAMASRNKAGQVDRAATLAQLAMERHPNDEKLATEAQEILAFAAEQLHRVVVSCDAKCSLVVGTTLVHGPPALQRVIYLDLGSHEIRASWRGDKGTRTATVEAEAGGVSSVEFEQPGVGFGGSGSGPSEAETEQVDDDFEEYIEEDFANEDVTQDQPPEKAGGLPPSVFVVGVVATAGLGGATIWSGIDTVNKPGKEKVEEKCFSTDCSFYQQGQEKEKRTNILIGATSVVGVATIVIGAVATNWGGKTKAAARRPAPRRAVEPWVTVGQGAAIGARGRF